MTIIALLLFKCSAYMRYQEQSGFEKIANLRWAAAQCQQQLGSTECGYFVMRFVFDIIYNHSTCEDLSKVCVIFALDMFYGMRFVFDIYLS